VSDADRAATLAAAAATLLAEARAAGRAMTLDDAVAEAHALYVRALARLAPTFLPAPPTIVAPPPPSFVAPSPPTPTLPPAGGGGPVVVGQVLGGRYRVDDFIGAGGSADVYRGTKLETGEAVALKVLRSTDAALW
jgi:hypothetical protein